MFSVCLSFVGLPMFYVEPAAKQKKKKRDKKVLKDKFSVFHFACVSSPLLTWCIYLFISLLSLCSISLLPPLSHAAWSDQYLIFSLRRWEVEVCDRPSSSSLSPPSLFPLSVSFHPSSPPLSFSLSSSPRLLVPSSPRLLALIDCSTRSWPAAALSVIVCLALALGFSLSNVMSRH